MPSNNVYPTDYTGSAATNLVTNESQVLLGAQGADFYFIVPQAAPFFKKNFALTYVDGNGTTRRMDENLSLIHI